MYRYLEMWRLGLALFSSGPPTLASFKLLVIAECTFLDTFRKSKRLLVSIVDEDLVIGLNIVRVLEYIPIGSWRKKGTLYL